MIPRFPRQGWSVAIAALVACLAAAASRAQARQWQAVPVAGGLDAVSSAAGLDPGLPAWRVLFEAVKRRHALWGEATGAGPVGGDDPREAGPSRTSVALPLEPAAWRRLLRKNGLADDRLAFAILADRRSSLLYRGLAGLDEPTLQALAAQPDALAVVHRCCADVMAAFGGRFRVRAGAVDVPGGEEAAPLWQDVVKASPREPLPFLVNLLRQGDGRRAFLYDSIARLDPGHQRFALGLQLPAGRVRLDAFRELAAAFDAESAWWRMEKGAFSRSPGDAARLLRELRLAGADTLAPPAARVFWEAVLDGKVIPKAEWLEAVRTSPPADAAWLAARVARGGAATRLLRFEQVLFAQRVFGDCPAESLAEAAVALRSLGDARALFLALERVGTQDPALYRAAASLARRAGPATGERAALHDTLQGALGVVDRARFARTLDVATAERLLRSLVAEAETTPGQARSVARWMESTMLPVLARAVYGAHPPGDTDTMLLRAMAGDRVDQQETLEPFGWEGLWYRADPGRSEFLRLERVRARQAAVPIAAALEACRAPAGTGGDPCAGSLGPALMSLVYAAHLGDAEGPALSGEDPSRRHEFGAEPWALPREVIGEGTPWHVRGSLLGLEQALAPLSVQRLAGHELPDAPPVLEYRQRRALAAAIAVVNPRELADPDRDALAAAVEAGRKRAATLRVGSPDIEAAGRDAGLEPWRVRALEWLLEHEPSAAGSFFSLVELLRLGAPRDVPWDAWGVADDLVSGLRPRLPGRISPDESSGRDPDAALAESFCDLGLRVAAHLAQRRLPASLAPALAGTLMGDLFAEARPVAQDDRLGLDAWVRAQSTDRLDDAVAALAGRGVVQPAPAPRGGR